MQHPAVALRRLVAVVDEVEDEPLEHRLGEDGHQLGLVPLGLLVLAVCTERGVLACQLASDTVKRALAAQGGGVLSPMTRTQRADVAPRHRLHDLADRHAAPLSAASERAGRSWRPGDERLAAHGGRVGLHEAHQHRAPVELADGPAAVLHDDILVGVALHGAEKPLLVPHAYLLLRTEVGDALSIGEAQVEKKTVALVAEEVRSLRCKGRMGQIVVQVLGVGHVGQLHGRLGLARWAKDDVAAAEDGQATRLTLVAVKRRCVEPVMLSAGSSGG